MCLLAHAADGAFKHLSGLLAPHTVRKVWAHFIDKSDKPGQASVYFCSKVLLLYLTKTTWFRLEEPLCKEQINLHPKPLLRPFRMPSLDKGTLLACLPAKQLFNTGLAARRSS